MRNDEEGAFRRLMECVEGGLDFTDGYGQTDAVRDYLLLRPGEHPADVRITLAERLYALHRIYGESSAGLVIEPSPKS